MDIFLLVGSLWFLIAVFTFDISFNLRRMNNNLDRVWRKLVEIENALTKT